MKKRWRCQTWSGTILRMWGMQSYLCLQTLLHHLKREASDERQDMKRDKIQEKSKRYRHEKFFASFSLKRRSSSLVFVQKEIDNVILVILAEQQSFVFIPLSSSSPSFFFLCPSSHLSQYHEYQEKPSKESLSKDGQDAVDARLPFLFLSHVCFTFATFSLSLPLLLKYRCLLFSLLSSCCSQALNEGFLPRPLRSLTSLTKLLLDTREK